MLRLRIKINNNSPFLRIASGVLYAEEVDTSVVSKPVVLLFKCKIKKEDGTLGYSACKEDETIPTKLFDCIKPIADQMIRSYWKGMILDRTDFCWVSMSGDDSWDKLANVENEIKKILKERK